LTHRLLVTLTRLPITATTGRRLLSSSRLIVPGSYIVNHGSLPISSRLAQGGLPHAQVAWIQGRFMAKKPAKKGKGELPFLPLRKEEEEEEEEEEFG